MYGDEVVDEDDDRVESLIMLVVWLDGKAERTLRTQKMEKAE